MPIPPRSVPALVLLVVAGLAVAGCTGGAGSGAAAASPPTASSSAPASGSGSAMALQSAYQQVIRQVLPSVVQITTGTALGSEPIRLPNP